MTERNEYFVMELKLHIAFESDLLEVTLVSTAKRKSLLKFSQKTLNIIGQLKTLNKLENFLFL